ncbi:hypothetical protein U1Q18_004653 [Sarracenia purpurea var. burkii]
MHGGSGDAGPQSKRPRTSPPNQRDSQVDQRDSLASQGPTSDRTLVGSESKIHRAESMVEKRVKKEPVGASIDEKSTVFIEGSSDLEAFERTLSNKDIEVMQAFSLITRPITINVFLFSCHRNFTYVRNIKNRRK